MPALDVCCQTEAGLHLSHHCDVARCDVCGRLVLGYGVEADYLKAVNELEQAGIPVTTGTSGDLFVIAKERLKKKTAWLGEMGTRSLPSRSRSRRQRTDG